MWLVYEGRTTLVEMVLLMTEGRCLVTWVVGMLRRGPFPPPPLEGAYKNEGLIPLSRSFPSKFFSRHSCSLVHIKVLYRHTALLLSSCLIRSGSGSKTLPSVTFV